MAEAIIVVQHWANIRSSIDCCRLCYERRGTPESDDWRRSKISSFNSVSGIMRLDKTPEFKESSRELDLAREVCLSAKQPHQGCFEPNQKALGRCLQLYENLIRELSKRLPEPSKKTFL